MTNGTRASGSAAVRRKSFGNSSTSQFVQNASTANVAKTASKGPRSLTASTRPRMSTPPNATKSGAVTYPTWLSP